MKIDSKQVAIGPLAVALIAIGLSARSWFSNRSHHDVSYSVTKTDAEWAKSLTPEQFHVARGKGTERPFTGAYWKTKEPGIYRCVCCDAELFRSTEKFDSGTGWPSFYDQAAPGAVDREQDSSLMMTRSEIICHQCGAHLGHVFDDGPRPTGERYCVNSASLKFEPKAE